MNKSFHTEQDLLDLIRKGIDVYKIPVDDLWIALARRVNVEEAYAKKEAARKGGIMTSPRPPIEEKPTCSECRSDPDEPVVKVGDDYYLCGFCAGEQVNALHRARAVIEMLTVYLVDGLPNCPQE